MSMDSDIRDIKSALTDAKRNLTEIHTKVKEIQLGVKDIQESKANDFFNVVKGTALAAAIAKISSMSDALDRIEKKLQ